MCAHACRLNGCAVLFFEGGGGSEVQADVFLNEHSVFCLLHILHCFLCRQRNAFGIALIREIIDNKIFSFFSALLEPWDSLFLETGSSKWLPRDMKKSDFPASQTHKY